MIYNLQIANGEPRLQENIAGFSLMLQHFLVINKKPPALNGRL